MKKLIAVAAVLCSTLAFAGAQVGTASAEPRKEKPKVSASGRAAPTTRADTSPSTATPAPAKTTAPAEK